MIELVDTLVASLAADVVEVAVVDGSGDTPEDSADAGEAEDGEDRDEGEGLESIAEAALA